jgi:beta-aspartyl-dipeptidase (metallo-type)
MLIIEGADVYSPAPLGRKTIVVAGGKIEFLGVPRSSSEFLGRLSPRNSEEPEGPEEFPIEHIDARDCIALPGLIDAHQHLIGGSGEQGGFASQTEGMGADRLIECGITSVVGTLGTDTTTRTLPALLAKVKALRERGLNAWMWTGGYDARPLTSSVRDDIILIAEILGAGEIAIADRRGAHFDARTLARLASDCYVAGTLTGKAGVLHLHTGEGGERLSLLRELLDSFEIPPRALYPTHVNRNDALFAEAIDLTKRGVTVDLDLVDENLVDWLRKFDGDPSMLTVSTDAPIGKPEALLAQIVSVIQEKIMPLETAFALGTRNPARVLNLRNAGELAPGKRADILLLDAKSLALRRVIHA